ncbi:iron-containing alcohol dehydrogenase [Falsibacillus albus]|uniref:Iron-containing alcohol dehydrogenase n=1 Tax=Falsibacillus albus TaxID=2478915 RepID=A0A3L7K5X9_9BACI|nr:iron-containing alcohol dehydrogenase [Falsibacillus albus]RLQ96112.1 iron-containing alcohol dehydrogenase [Falsibacillus albus]
MVSALKFPRTSFTGWGAIDMLFPELKKMDIHRILVVADPILIETGTVEQIIKPLMDVFALEVYSDVEPEPSLSCAQELVEYTRNHTLECVIGIGGGSTLDLAKLTAVVSQNDGQISDYLNLSGGRRLLKKGLPKILIPTTSGTGSEVTDIAVVSLEGTKDVITHEFLLADAAIVDPQLTLSVPPRVTAATGMDALTHAVEAFVSVHANEVTDALALQAIKLIGNSVKNAVKDGTDKKARTDMSFGSYLAGLAFFNAGVAGVHALAYPLGSAFKLPHGEANAVLLPYVMSFISQSCREKMDIINKILESTTQAIGESNIFHRLVRELGLPETLQEYDIGENHLEALADEAVKQKRLLDRSPMPLKREDILQIYQMALHGELVVREVK